MKTYPVVFVLAAEAIILGANPPPVAIFPTTAARGGDVRVTVPNAPKVDTATVRLISRNGPRPDFDATSVKDGTVEFTVPADLPLGSYSVTVVLGGGHYPA